MKHHITLDIFNVGLRRHEITDAQFKRLMQVPWNTPKELNGMIIEHMAANGFLIVSVI